jgi:phospholipid/cholesterol/gamma-HCH transport system substrate-binding protein
MLKYRGKQLIRVGSIGAVLIILVIAIGLNFERLTAMATSARYRALFTEAGGLTPGNTVLVSGMKVGTVSDVSLENGKALVTFTADAKTTLRSETTAHIRTGTLLGQRVLTLESAGSGRMHSSDVIPVSRTSSPYSLTEATNDLTTNVAGTDTQALNRSLDALSDTIDQIAPQLGPSFEGLSRMSQALNERNQSLSELLRSATDMTGVLSKRSEQINSLILNANDLLSVLVTQRQAIVELLANVSAVARAVSGVVHDNEPELEPTLQKLNSVTAMLEKNRDNIAKALPGLAKAEGTLGEALSSGFFYQGFIANLPPSQLLQPFLDYAFGFRRGTNAGQPPDNAGPRAELPFPYNGIPGPGEQWGPPR